MKSLFNNHVICQHESQRYSEMRFVSISPALPQMGKKVEGVIFLIGQSTRVIIIVPPRVRACVRGGACTSLRSRVQAALQSGALHREGVVLRIWGAAHRKHVLLL